jgi:amino acid adenylation domain-containing protein
VTPLHRLLEASALRRGAHPAILAPSGRTISYADLDRLADRVRDRLIALGVARGDRVGLFVHKSIDTVAAIFGILKAGAAYVPVDASAPAARGAFILADCGVKACFVERAAVDALAGELAAQGASPRLFVIETPDDGSSLSACLDASDRSDGAAPTARSVEVGESDLAYILYTSGSTGKPKGVVISQGNATCFVDWCSEVLAPNETDRFSSHAPFHFDLSILDIYTAIQHGATLVLIDEEVGKRPSELAAWIEQTGITIWYSAPSILTMLVQHGALESRDHGRVRIVCFAGEVFPVVHLRSLMRLWPGKRFLNLYGPTETNVCTWYEIPAVVPEDRKDPYPIGPVCAHLRAIVVDPEGREVAPGQEGELCIAGPSVLQRYWNLEEQTARSLLPNRTDDRWYRTGDLVREDPVHGYIYLGRRDRMVKKRGYRVELGEIEACLYQHPEVLEAAVVAIPDEAAGVLIRAHLSTKSGEKISLIKLKKFCAERVPVYMVPDTFSFHEKLPKTSTDKVDYQRLKSLG